MEENVPAFIKNQIYRCFAQMCLQDDVFKMELADTLQDATDSLMARITLDGMEDIWHGRFALEK
jgi:hypothetical protein